MDNSNKTNIFGWTWYGIQAVSSAIYKNILPDVAQQKASLKGKKALITGAGGGIGKHIALNLAKKGCDLILWDVSEKAILSTLELCTEYEITIDYDVVDLTNRESVYENSKKLTKKYGSIDILINNAGIISDNNNGFLHCNDEKMEMLMKVNIISHFWTVKAFLPSMIEKKSGHIVSIASMAGICGAPGLVDYSSSKFAAIGFMEALEAEIQQKEGCKNIKFTTICPCFVNTPMVNDNNVHTMNLKLLTPESVGKIIVDSIRLQKHIVFIPGKYEYLNAIKGITPWNLWKSIVANKKI